jgi:hypothetical protein
MEQQVWGSKHRAAKHATEAEVRGTAKHSAVKPKATKNLSAKHRAAKYEASTTGSEA